MEKDTKETQTNQAKNNLTENAYSHKEIEQVYFLKLAQFLKEKTGIHLPLSDKNITLLSSRVVRLLKKFQLKDYKELTKKILDGNYELIEDFVICMTTNMTSFFRESQHFDLLPAFLNQILEKKRRHCEYEIRIWCAAASTGEEPYTIAMILDNVIPKDETWQVLFLATDIDKSVLNKASVGIYTQKEIENLPKEYLVRYFSKGKGTNANNFRVVKELRSQINFAIFNLIEDIYPFQHKFDIIFCRNVLIYFDKDQVDNTVKKFAHNLNDDGYLFLGHSESLLSVPHDLASVASSVYQKKNRLEKV